MQKDTPVTRVEIRGELTICTTAALRQQLLDAFDTGSKLEVDLSAVSEMDSAGMQLMVAAKLAAAVRNQPLCFTEHSPVVFGTLELCNLSGHLGDPVLIRSRTQRGKFNES